MKIGEKSPFTEHLNLIDLQYYISEGEIALKKIVVS